MSKPMLKLSLVISFLHVVLLLLVKFDTAFTYRWLLLFYYFGILSICPLFLLIRQRIIIKQTLLKLKSYLITTEGKNDLWLFMLVVVLAILTRFLFLKDHPFLTWGDEIWEAGLDTLAVISGEIKNFYIVGFPDSYRMPSMGYIQTLI